MRVESNITYLETIVKNLFIFTCTVLIMLLGVQPAIAAEIEAKEYCIFIPPKDKTGAENSNQYRNGIIYYYDYINKKNGQDKIKIITNGSDNCEKELLHIESYKPVKQKRKKIPIISLHNETIEEDNPYQFFLTPNDVSFTNAVNSYMKKRLGVGDKEVKGKPIYNNSIWSGWSKTNEGKLSYVLMRGKDVNIPFAIQSANYLDYPVSKLIGYTWDDHSEDLKKLGEIADGYQTLSVINATTSKLINEIGKDSNNIYWELGVLAAIVSSEAIYYAVKEFYAGKFDPNLNAGQVRWALENLNLSEDDLKRIGIENLVSPIKMDCNNDNILREIYIQKWDADSQKWDTIYDFIDENDEDKGQECMPDELKIILDRSSDKEKKSKALNALPEAEIKTLDYANFSNITPTEEDIKGKDHTEAYLFRTGLTNIILIGVNLAELYLTKVNLSGADLTEADLTGADLTGADLTGADLTGADLTGADLTGADLTGADLTGADLTGADLTGADLTGADLTNTTLTAVNSYDVKSEENQNETFEDFIDALEKNKGYIQVTANIAKLKRQSLLDYIRNYKQRGTDPKKCRSEIVKIANEFKTYWDTYIRQSLIQYLTGGTTNDTVLNQAQLGEVLTELSTAINTVKPHADATTANFFVLPGPGGSTNAPTVVDQKRNNIKKLILDFKCPYPKSP